MASLYRGLLLKPLNAEEEEIYLQKMAQGDKEAEEILIIRNLRLVIYIAKKFTNTSMDLEELSSVGNVGLIKGIRTYSTEKKSKLATYLTTCITNEILMFLRKENKLRYQVSINEPLAVDNNGNELNLEDLIMDSKSDFTQYYIQNEEFIEILSYLLNNFKVKEKVIMLYYLAGIRQNEIGTIINISQSYVSRIITKTTTKITTKITTKKITREETQLYVIKKNSEDYCLYIQKDKIKNEKQFYKSIQEEIDSRFNKYYYSIVEKGKTYVITFPNEVKAYILLATVVNCIES